MALDSTVGTSSVSEVRSRASRQPDGHDGIVGSFLALSLGMLESGVRTSAGVSRTLASESQKVAEAMIRLNEESSQALLRTARKLNEATFGLLTDAINRAEGAALVVLSQGQKTSDRVAELAAQASQAAVGSRGLDGAASA